MIHLRPCCQWPVPKFTSLSPTIHSESPETTGPLIHSGHGAKSWKPERREGTSTRVPASSRPRAEIKLDPGSSETAPRALRFQDRPSQGRRPPTRPQSCAVGAWRQQGKAGQGGRDAGGALCAGARRPASPASAPGRAARALPLSPAPPDGPGPRFTPTPRRARPPAGLQARGLRLLPRRCSSRPRLAFTLSPGPARPRATAPPPTPTPPPPRLFRPPVPLPRPAAAAPDEVMATANFGKIQIGIYVEIKRSDGEPRRRPCRSGPAFERSRRGRGVGRLIDCSAGLWGREGGGRGAFVCGVCASEAGVGSAPGAAAVRGAGRGCRQRAWVSRAHLWGSSG